jgi:hypothetical protein
MGNEKSTLSEYKITGDIYLFKKKNAIKISCFPNKLILTHKNEDLYDKMGNFIID